MFFFLIILGIPVYLYGTINLINFEHHFGNKLVQKNYFINFCENLANFKMLINFEILGQNGENWNLLSMFLPSGLQICHGLQGRILLISTNMRNKRGMVTIFLTNTFAKSLPYFFHWKHNWRIQHRNNSQNTKLMILCGPEKFILNREDLKMENLLYYIIYRNLLTIEKNYQLWNYKIMDGKTKKKERWKSTTLIFKVSCKNLLSKYLQ